MKQTVAKRHVGAHIRLIFSCAKQAVCLHLTHYLWTFKGWDLDDHGGLGEEVECPPIVTLEKNLAISSHITNAKLFRHNGKTAVLELIGTRWIHIYGHLHRALALADTTMLGHSEPWFPVPQWGRKFRKTTWRNKTHVALKGKGHWTLGYTVSTVQDQDDRQNHGQGHDQERCTSSDDEDETSG